MRVTVRVGRRKRWNIGAASSTMSAARLSTLDSAHASNLNALFMSYNMVLELSWVKHGMLGCNDIKGLIEMCKRIILEAIERTNWQLDI